MPSPSGQGSYCLEVRINILGDCDGEDCVRILQRRLKGVRIVCLGLLELSLLPSSVLARSSVFKGQTLLAFPSLVSSNQKDFQHGSNGFDAFLLKFSGAG